MTRANKQERLLLADPPMAELVLPVVGACSYLSAHCVYIISRAIITISWSEVPTVLVARKVWATQIEICDLFWHITPRTLLKFNRHFGRTCCLHLQDRTLLATSFMIISCLAYSSTLKLETCSSEMSIDFQGLHGVISQKMELWEPQILRRRHELISRQKQGFFFSASHPYRLWIPLGCLASGFWDFGSLRAKQTEHEATIHKALLILWLTFPYRSA
jgi:hypothetical protein